MKQSLIQTQRLIITPQLRQFLELLQLPVYELEQRIEQELIQNPALEEISDSAPEEELQKDETPAEPEEENRPIDTETLQSFERIFDTPQDTESEDFSRPDPGDAQKKRDYQESILVKPSTLADFLEWQLGILDLTGPQKKIAIEIIGSINEDGWLAASVEEMASATNESAEAVEEVLHKIQSLDPTGVGARTLKETLLIQLRREPQNTDVAQTIVSAYFELLRRKHFDLLAKTLNTTPSTIKRACEQISRLEPKPGRIFYDNKPNFVIPDAKVSLDPETETELQVEITNETIPNLRINAAYRSLARQKNLDTKTREFLKQKIHAGLDLIRAVAQRKSTLALITDELVKVQRDFFTKGFSHLKPLRLKDVAEKIGLHESTVSRAIQAKYIDTPQGTIPYKSFFSTKLPASGENGVSESQKSALERLKNLISNEDKGKPLSDAKLARLLETEGVKIARRTVAKYRDLLKILPAHLRKER